MRLKLLKIIIVSCFVLVPGIDGMAQTAAPGERFDIAGIRLGMSPQQVLAALRAHEAFMPEPILVHALPGPALPTGATVRSIDAYRAAPPPSQAAEQVIVLFTRRLPPRAFMIAQLVSYAAGQRPQRAAFDTALRARYGAPSFHQNPRGDSDLYLWDYNAGLTVQADPNVAAGRALLAACADRSDTTAARILGTPETGFSDDLLVPDSIDPGCGLRMRVQVQSEAGRVTRFRADLVGDQLAVEDSRGAPPP